MMCGSFFHDASVLRMIFTCTISIPSYTCTQGIIWNGKWNRTEILDGIWKMPEWNGRFQEWNGRQSSVPIPY